MTGAPFRVMVAVGVAIASTVGACPVMATGAETAAPTSATQVGFWTGQNTTQCSGSDPCPRDLSAFTPAVWRALQRGHGALYFDLAYTQDFGPGASRTDALPVIRKANALGVTVKAWLTAPADQGTFANEDNAAFQAAAVKAFYRWRNAKHLRIDEAILDLEFPVGSQAVQQAIGPATVAGKRGTFEPAHQCAAMRVYARAISWAHRHGLVLSGSPMPFLLDDLDNGDLALADEIDAAPLFPRGYDHLYLQAYRTYSDTGPDYPAQYMQRMKHYFGHAAEISLGDTTMGPPYQSVDALVTDVRAAAALGATALPIFELASSVQKYGAAGIQQILDAGRHPLSKTQLASVTSSAPMTTSTLTFFQALDDEATGASPTPNSYPDGCAVKVARLRG